MKYLAYFQAYTNTYDSLENLKAKYEEALRVRERVGYAAGLLRVERRRQRRGARRSALERRPTQSPECRPIRRFLNKP